MKVLKVIKFIIFLPFQIVGIIWHGIIKWILAGMILELFLMLFGGNEPFEFLEDFRNNLDK